MRATVTLGDGPHEVASPGPVGIAVMQALDFDPLDRRSYRRLWPWWKRHADGVQTFMAGLALLAGVLTEAEPRDAEGNPQHIWTREDVARDLPMDAYFAAFEVAMGLMEDAAPAARKKKGGRNG